MFELRLPDGCVVCQMAKTFHQAAQTTEPDKGERLMGLALLQGFAVALIGRKEFCLDHATTLAGMNFPDHHRVFEAWPELGAFWDELQQANGKPVRARIVQEQDITVETSNGK